jgi:predicted nicotinamide N-methyase
VACDLDPMAAESQQANAELNGVVIESLIRDPVGRPLRDVDVVLAGDVCYERSPARHITAWLRYLAEDGMTVLLADPGRAYAPSKGLELLDSFTVATSRELESADEMETRVWRIAA